MKEKLHNLITEALKSLGLEAEDFILEHPSELKMGDYSTNVAIKFGHKDEILQFLVENKPEGIEKIELAGPGFTNFYLSKEFFKKSLGEIIEKGSEFGKNRNLEGKKYFIEHSQPNPFKEFHIGHLMNNAIGESIARIIKANGAEVKTSSYHGDVGLHVAKAVWAMRKGIEYEKAYAFGNKAYEESENVKKEITDLNIDIYKNWEIVADGIKRFENYFEAICKKLGTEFDYRFWEHISGEIGKDIVSKNVGKVFEESEGAIVFKGEKFGLHTRVFLNSKRLPTYEAKEVGLAQIKKNLFPYDISITITANEQDAFFNVVEVATEEIFPELKNRLKHISHGILKLPSGKMSSRTGDVITAEALIEDVKKKVKGDEAVAIGAIKYMILRQAIGNDIIFDIDQSVSVEGDSGVYLQYAYARTNSLLEKAKSQGLSTYYQGLPLIQGGETHEIERLLYRFPEVVERAGKEYAPHYITTYLTELAGSFNNFYAHEEILGNPYRVAITKAFNIVMKNGLTILGIPAPERM